METHRQAYGNPPARIWKPVGLHTPAAINSHIFPHLKLMEKERKNWAGIAVCLYSPHDTPKSKK